MNDPLNLGIPRYSSYEVLTIFHNVLKSGYHDAILVYTVLSNGNLIFFNVNDCKYHISDDAFGDHFIKYNEERLLTNYTLLDLAVRYKFEVKDLDIYNSDFLLNTYGFKKFHKSFDINRIKDEIRDFKLRNILDSQ